MGDVTDEQLPPDADPADPERDDQPIVPMFDLSAEEEPFEPQAALAAEGEPPRLRMVGGILLLFGALAMVVALVLPLYRIGQTVGVSGGFVPLNGGLGDNDFVVNAWGMVQQGGLPDSVAQLINVLVGNTPMWGIPLVFVALLLVVAGGLALWRPTVPYVAGAAIGATALLAGCFAMLTEFMTTTDQPGRIGPFTTSIGPGFWLLVFAVILALGGLAAVLFGRPATPARQPVASQPERDEPDTPPMGFPAPVVLPELDDNK